MLQYVSSLFSLPPRNPELRVRLLASCAQQFHSLKANYIESLESCVENISTPHSVPISHTPIHCPLGWRCKQKLPSSSEESYFLTFCGPRCIFPYIREYSLLIS